MSNDGSNYGVTYAEGVTLDPTKAPLKRRTGWRPRQLNDPGGTGTGTGTAPGPPPPLAPGERPANVPGTPIEGPPGGEVPMPPDEGGYSEGGGYTEDAGGYSEDPGYQESVYTGAPAQQGAPGRVGGMPQMPKNKLEYYPESNREKLLEEGRVVSDTYMQKLKKFRDLHLKGVLDAKQYVDSKADLDAWRDGRMAEIDQQIDTEVADAKKFRQTAEGTGVERVKVAGEAQRAPAEHAKKQAERAAEFGEEVHATYEKAGRAEEQYQVFAGEAERRANNRMWEAQESIEAADKEVQSTHIDPGRSWKNKNAPMKILSMFAAAINGYITAIQGRENEVLKMIDAEIERDIDAQKSDLETKKLGARAKRSEYAILKSRLGDEQQARNLLKRRRLNTVQADLNQMGRMAKTQEQRDIVAFYNDGIENAKQQTDLGIEHRARTILEAKDYMDRQALGQHAARVAKANQVAKSGYAEMEGKYAKNVIWAPGGGAIGIAPHDMSEKAQYELAGQLAQIHTDGQTIDRLVQIADDLGAGLMAPSEAASEFRQGFQMIRAPAKKEIAGAAENAAEKVAIDQIFLGDGSGFTGQALGRAAPALRRYKATKEREMEHKLNANGVQRADVQTVPNPDKPGSYNYYYRPGAAPRRGAKTQEGVAPR